MALTITEACAINTLFDFVLGPRPLLGKPTPAECEKAASLLAEHADHTLHGGWDARLVYEHWPRFAARSADGT